jgi:hypothetical protein
VVAIGMLYDRASRKPKDYDPRLIKRRSSLASTRAFTRPSSSCRHCTWPPQHKAGRERLLTES